MNADRYIQRLAGERKVKSTQGWVKVAPGIKVIPNPNIPYGHMFMVDEATGEIMGAYNLEEGKEGKWITQEKTLKENESTATSESDRNKKEGK